MKFKKERKKKTVGWLTRGCEYAGGNYDFTGNGEEQLLKRQLLLFSFLRRGNAEVGEMCTRPEN